MFDDLVCEKGSAECWGGGLVEWMVTNEERVVSREMGMEEVLTRVLDGGGRVELEGYIYEQRRK